jgi:DNA recombination protein Rad52
MSFSTAQLRKLQRDVKADDIRKREVNGKELSYIEGWHAIAEANRIFGFDGWNRETIESRCVLVRETRGEFNVIYIAKVRITVRADTELVVREGFGTGDARAPSAGEAHDKAIKTAETDATKRALATFGKPFGLALYVGSRQTPKPRPDIQRRRTLQRLGPNGRYHVPAQPKPPTVMQMLAGPAGPEPTVRVDSADAPSDPGDPTDSAASPAPASEGRLLIERGIRRRDADHLRFVAAQPCLICSKLPSDAHHLKFAQSRAMSKKVSDEFTVPLCRTHHRQLHHAGNEVNWWMDLDVDPLPIAQDLWDQSKAKRGQSANGQ